MGMDVFGKNPKSEKGEYFRNNVWWWRPLAIYCEDVHPDLTAACEYWHSNDGDGLDEADAEALGHALLADIASGVTAEWSNDYYRRLSELPRRDCELCGTTGIRRDEVGQEMGMPDKALSTEVAILTGREFGWCNACDGVGTMESWEANYPFSVENVQEFAEFLLECGGFQIC